MNKTVYIVSATRTPIGAYLGALSSLTAPQLGAIAVGAALEGGGVDAGAVDECYLGNVLGAGIGQAPARQAARAAKLPDSVPTTTVNKVCGSGLQAAILGAKSLLLGDAEIVVAGGMESMSKVPYYLQKARTGYRMGNDTLVDGMVHDGLWDPYQDTHMGNFGELCAREHDCSREAQDAFAAESYRRAVEAQTSGAFSAELVSVQVPQRKADPIVVSEDEEPGRGKPEKFPKLRPAFAKDGTITAANASSVNDGASALVLASEEAVKAHGLKPLAKIVAYGAGAQAPEWFTMAPAKAMSATMERAKIAKDAIDLFEINEAFSCVTMANARALGLDLDRVNVHGGAVALGHPIGCSGARILTTLVHALKHHDKERGMAGICIGGGEALAMVVERA